MKNIRKAVFPVAGLGTRFLPATKASPKEMLPIVDKPLIQYAAEEAVAAGIDTLIFINGRNKRAIEDHFDKAYELEAELEAKGKEKLLKLAQEKNVGVIGLKPFGAGTTFGLKPQQIQGKIDQRASSLVKEMLQEKRISAVIPGVNIPEQLEVNVRGSYEKDQPKTDKDEQALRECRQNYYAHLTPGYQWLRQWEYV